MVHTYLSAGRAWLVKFRRIGLVGCVKEKRSRPAKAADLYTSRLFAGRRHFVESSCHEWWILSAAHGLVDPSTVLEPYDVTLKNAGRAACRAWSARVLASVGELVRPVRGDIFELHAGAEYRDYGLVAGLTAQGFAVEIPTLGMPIGLQLRFYRQHASQGA